MEYNNIDNNILKPIVILVMGGPASGKGTYCSKLSSKFGLIHLSIGDILREERKKETEEGRLLNKNMQDFESTGALMSCDKVAHFLLKRMKEYDWKISVFLIDGFIKAEIGYFYWMDKLDPIFDLKFVLYLECSKSEMLKRMGIRGEKSGRLDDNKKIFEIRVKTFFERTYPALELFAMRGIVKKINTEGEIDFIMKKINNFIL